MTSNNTTSTSTTHSENNLRKMILLRQLQQECEQTVGLVQQYIDYITVTLPLVKQVESTHVELNEPVEQEQVESSMINESNATFWDQVSRIKEIADQLPSMNPLSSTSPKSHFNLSPQLISYQSRRYMFSTDVSLYTGVKEPQDFIQAYMTETSLPDPRVELSVEQLQQQNTLPLTNNSEFSTLGENGLEIFEIEFVLYLLFLPKKDSESTINCA